MGPKVGFGVQKMGHFCHPCRDFREKPLFSQSRGGGHCFLKMALKQSRPSITLHIFLSISQTFGQRFMGTVVHENRTYKAKKPLDHFVAHFFS